MDQRLHGLGLQTASCDDMAQLARWIGNLLQSKPPARDPKLEFQPLAVFVQGDGHPAVCLLELVDHRDCRHPPATSFG